MRDALDPAGLPTVCDDCGARHSFRRRFVADGDWWTVYRYSECGSRVSSNDDGDEWPGGS